MKLEFSFFASAAIVQPDGVFSALEAGIVALYPATLPAIKSQLVLIAVVSFSPEECDQDYQTLVRVLAPDGDSLSPECRLVMHPLRSDAFPGCRFTGQYIFDGLCFPSRGAYRFELFANAKRLGEAILLVGPPKV